MCTEDKKVPSRVKSRQQSPTREGKRSSHRSTYGNAGRSTSRTHAVLLGSRLLWRSPKRESLPSSSKRRWKWLCSITGKRYGFKGRSGVVGLWR